MGTRDVGTRDIQRVWGVWGQEIYRECGGVGTRDKYRECGGVGVWVREISVGVWGQEIYRECGCVGTRDKCGGVGTRDIQRVWVYGYKRYT